jgi:2,4-dienoyl-CoA reductase-like NADH-dependent reductase (Old Yellow Enzyme family)
VTTSVQQDVETVDPLFDPVSVGGVRLRNRTAVAPMTRISAAADGTVGERNGRYYAGFARGGFGLVITEGTYTDTAHSQGYLNQPGLATLAHAASWRAVVDAVHSEGAAIFAQLMHAGAQSQGNTYRPDTVAASAVAPKGPQSPLYRGSGPFPTPRALDTAGIREVRQGFVTAARNAVTAGFDGVEVHGANGYLLDQFLTDYSNQRDDHYGGATANRVRLLAEVCDEVLQAVGAEISVGVRVSQGKVTDFAHRWAGAHDDAATVFEALGRTGVHYIHTTEFHAVAPAFSSGEETLAALARTHGGAPVVANGQLDDPDVARDLLRRGHADVVAIGKGALAQPHWPTHVRAGREMDASLPPELLSPLADIKDWELDRRTA